MTVTLTCPFGEVTGTAPSPSAPLFTDSGGLIMLHGLTDLAGGVLVPITPGLERTGELVRCTYFSESRQQQVVAYVRLVP